MTGLYLVGGIVALGLMVYLVIALLEAGDLLMTANGIFQLVFYVVVLVALAKPLGGFMAKVYEGRRTWLDPVLGPIERLIYRLCGVRPADEMGWKTYAVAMLLFNFARPPRRLRAPAPAGRAAAEPAGHGGGHARLVVQHRGELRHQHELAGLRRRDAR